MRVLIKTTEEVNNCEVIKIECAGWDDDITCVKNDDGTYDKYKVEPKTGLYIKDMDGDYLYIEGISKEICVKITEELLRNGYADLRSYGVFKWEFDYKAEEDVPKEDISSDSVKSTPVTVVDKAKSIVTGIFLSGIIASLVLPLFN